MHPVNFTLKCQILIIIVKNLSGLKQKMCILNCMQKFGGMIQLLTHKFWKQSDRRKKECIPRKLRKG